MLGILISISQLINSLACVYFINSYTKTNKLWIRFFVGFFGILFFVLCITTPFIPLTFSINNLFYWALLIFDISISVFMYFALKKHNQELKDFLKSLDIK